MITTSPRGQWVIIGSVIIGTTCRTAGAAKWYEQNPLYPYISLLDDSQHIYPGRIYITRVQNRLCRYDFEQKTSQILSALSQSTCVVSVVNILDKFECDIARHDRMIRIWSVCSSSEEMIVGRLMSDDMFLQDYGGVWGKVERALNIWRGCGMSIQGVRSCGDYMFSGHTVIVTILNFFITECKGKFCSDQWSLCTVRYCYNAVHFLQNPHIRVISVFYGPNLWFIFRFNPCSDVWNIMLYWTEV